MLRLSSLAFCFFLLFPWSLCLGASRQSSRKLVFVSIMPQKAFVEAIAKGKVDVEVMVPPGANPHVFEPKPSQLKKLSKADMYVKVGTAIEFELQWMEKIKKLNPRLKMVDMSKGIPLIETEDEDIHDHQRLLNNGRTMNVDPHIWLSLKNLSRQIKNIAGALMDLDPVNKGFYEVNLKEYIRYIEGEISGIEKILGKGKSYRFITVHPSLTYFAHDFNLLQIPVRMSDKEPTAGRLKNIIDVAKKERIRIIIASPQFPSRDAKVIASAIEGRVIYFDPLAENYVENISKIATALTQR